MVKKVIAKKNKVSIKDPETMKQLTVVIDDRTKLKGYGGIGGVKKKGAIKEHYFITDKGFYIGRDPVTQ